MSDEFVGRSNQREERGDLGIASVKYNMQMNVYLKSSSMRGPLVQRI